MFATFFRLVDGTQQHPGIADKVRIAPKLVSQQPGKAAKVVACGGHHGQGSMDFVRTHKKLVLVGNNAAMNFFRQLSERNLPGNFEQCQPDAISKDRKSTRLNTSHNYDSRM